MNRQDVSDLTIERYLLNELPEEKKAHIDTLRANDPELDARIQAVSRENDTFFKEHPADLFVERIERQTAEEKLRNGAPENFSFKELLRRIRSGFTIRNIASASAAAVVVALVLLFTPFDTGKMTDPVSPADDGIRLKGGPSLLIYRKDAGDSTLLGDGATAHAGDRLQLYYRSAGFRYGVILSVDGNGVVTRHLPIAGNEAVLLEKSSRVQLPTSYTLDDAPDYEKFYFFASRKPFAVQDVIDIVQDAAGSGELDSDVISYSVYTIYKAE